MTQLHMDEKIIQKIEAQAKKLEEIYASVEKMRKYFLWTLIISAGMVILPMLGLIIIIPWFLKVMGSAYQGLL